MDSVTPPDNAPLMLGPPLIGVMINWWLYGILVMQYLMYFSGPIRDGKILRGIVHLLFLLDTIQTLITMDDVFFWFVYNYGDYSALLRFNIASIDGPFLDAIITFTVQLVYCWRLRVIGKWNIMPTICALASMASVSSIGGITVGIHDVVSTKEIKPAVYLWLFASAITDIVIASSMAYLLMKYQKENASRTTMAIVKRIVLLTLETNAVTAALAIALVSVFLTPSISPPKTNIYLSFGYTLGKMYSNCFMVLLNQRIYYNTHGTTEEVETLDSANHRSRGIMANRHNSPSSRNKSTPQINVVQFTETRVDGPTEIEMGSVHSVKGRQDIKYVPGGHV
ncbi:hypothetical protein D9756_009072 [Leucocoprinus leucothites]|uniref:DUF6534 domain-containing protein n=1 Tax=Leucocoprinus leucothites TaxID=201217 RepID=A0A8H5CZ87_9AGAR|nr:hypothetical protein D9756_009072 [Leucoagaricus leucothites]